MPFNSDIAGGRPRGSTIWAGLNGVGEEIVAHLKPWLAEPAADPALVESTRLLPRLSRTPMLNGHADSGGLTDLRDALGSLLNASQSRHPDHYADRVLLTPHVWLVGDLNAPETNRPGPTVAGVQRLLSELHTPARVYLLLLVRTWGQEDQVRRDAMIRLEGLIDTVTHGPTPGSAPVIPFVISDRDGIGAVYTENDCDVLARRFAEFVLLTDAPHLNLEPIARAFGPSLPIPGGHPERLPVFGGINANGLLWDAAALARQNSERRRQDLTTALEAPVPLSWAPSPPHLERIDLTTAATWPQLDLPRWDPTFGNTPRREFDRVQAVTEDWWQRARRWRHAMRRTFADREAFVIAAAGVARNEYARDLDERARAILDDDSLPGFYAPLARLYQISLADLRVTNRDLRAQVNHDFAGTEHENLDAMTPHPDHQIAGTDQPLIRALERKVNPWLLLQVTLMTGVLTWWWINLIANNLAASALGWLLRAVGGWTAVIPEPVRDWATRALTWSPVDPGRFALYSALAIAGFLLFTSVVTVLRSRIGLERAFLRFEHAARGWRNELAGNLEAALAERERLLALENLAALDELLEERLARLGVVAAAARASLPAPVVSPALNLRLPMALPVAGPLTSGQVFAAVRAFRTRCVTHPGLTSSPEPLFDCLFREAAALAGDPRPDLLSELPSLNGALSRAIPSDHSVHIPPAKTVVQSAPGPPTTVRLLAAPARMAHRLGLDDPDLLILPLADGVEDAFFTLTIQRGFSVERVLLVSETGRRLPEQEATAVEHAVARTS